MLRQGDCEKVSAMISELCDLEDGLTDWEAEFVEKVSHEPVANLTAGQVEKIWEIHQKRIA